MTLKDLISPSEGFKQIVNDFLCETLYQADEEAYRYNMLDFYDVYLLGKPISGYGKWVAKMHADIINPHSKETTVKIETHLSKLAWNGTTIKKVQQFLSTQGLPGVLLSDMWLLWCTIYYRTNEGGDKERNKERENTKLSDYQQIENKIIPFLAYLFDKDEKYVKRGGFKYPVGKDLEITFRCNDKSQSLKLKGRLAQILLDDLRQSSLDLLQKWDKLEGQKRIEKNLIRAGWSDSAKFVFKAMQYMRILEADKVSNANAEHKRFISCLMNQVSPGFYAYYNDCSSTDEDLIKSLLE